MCKSILILSLLFTCISLNQAYKRLFTSISLADYDNDEVVEIGRFNKYMVTDGFQPVAYDKELMAIAQIEAERMARVGKLEQPKFKFRRSYFGYSFKVTGYIGKKYSRVLFFLFSQLHFC